MKKIVLVVMAISVFIVCPGAFSAVEATTSTQTTISGGGVIAVTSVDSEQAARAFLRGRRVSYYQGYAGGKLVYPNGSFVYIDMVLSLNTKLQPTWLRINGVDIPIPPTTGCLPGLPVGSIGVLQDFYVGVYGYNDKGDSSCYGTFNTPMLQPGEQVKLSFRPADVKTFITFALNGANADDIVLTLDGAENCWYSYNEQLGGFEVWYDPSSNHQYSILNRYTKQSLAAGDITPFNNSPQPAYSVLACETREGNVVHAELDQYNWFEVGHLDTDCLIERDGNRRLAKVFYLDNIEVGKNLQVYTGNLRYPRIEVRAYSDNGEMPLLDAVDSNSLSVYGVCSSRLVITVYDREYYSPSYPGLSLSLWSW